MVISTIPNTKPDSKAADSSLFQELDRHRRRGWFGWHTFGCLFVVVLLGLIGAGLTIVAQSGLVMIPGVTQLVYPTPPEPSRIVLPEPVDMPKLAAEAATGDGSFTLTEGQLTTLVDADHLPAFRQSQISVDAGQATFFGYYAQPPVGGPVPIELAISSSPSSGNTYQCVLSSARVGRVTVPAVGLTQLEPLVCAAVALPFRTIQLEPTSITLGTKTATVRTKPTGTTGNTPAQPIVQP
jgi:hypothetical protein